MILADRIPASTHRPPVRRHRGFVVDMLVLIGFVVLTIVLTSPMVWHLSDSLPGYPPVDNFHYLWELWYPAHAIFDLHTSPFLDRNIYSPFGFDLIRNQDMSPATVLLFVPLTRAVGEVVAYNLIVLMSFPLTALGTYLLCRELWGSRLAGIVAGTAVGFCAYRVSHALGHLSTVTTQWIPFFLLYVERSIKHPTRRNGVLAGLFYSLSALSTWYYAVACALSTLLYVSVRLTISDRSHMKTLLRPTVAAALVSLALVAPFAVPYTTAVTSGAMTNRPASQQETFAASVADFFIPTASHPIWGRWVAQHWRAGANGQWPSEWQIYLGTFVVALAVVGVCAERTRTVWALIAVGFGMFLVALGPHLQITHQPVGAGASGARLWPIPLPVRVLGIMPPFSLLRAWSRMGFVVELVVGLLAARGVLLLFDWPPRVIARTAVWPVVVTVVASSLAIVDTLAVPFTRSSVQPRRVDLWLAAQPGDFAIAEYPVTDHGWSGPAMYRRRVTGKRIVFAGTVIYPPNQDYWPVLSRYPVPETLDLLQWWDVKYVVVDEARYRSGAEFWGVVQTWKTLQPAMVDSGRLMERAVFDGVHVYELLDDPSRAVAPELLTNQGFEEVDGGVPARWTRIGSRDEAVVDTQGHLGKAAVSVTANSYFISSPITVVPGQCYQVQQFSRGRHLDDQTRLQVNWLDASGRDLGGSAALVRVFNAYPSWRRAQASARAPMASRAARIYAIAQRGQIWLDDYSFRASDDRCATGVDNPEIGLVVNRTTPSLVATPNPVPPSAGGVGRTTIVWSTGKEPAGPIYVSENGGPEILFAGESQYGSQDAAWIGVGKSYEFRLYSGRDRRHRLAAAVVTGRADPVLFATPNPVPAGPSVGRTEIRWNTGDGRVGEVYLSVDNGSEILFARNPAGSQEAGWIANGSRYVFRLYRMAPDRTLLASTTVQRGDVVTRAAGSGR